MNIELLQRVKQHILAEPRRLNMGTWVSTVGKTVPAFAGVYGRDEADLPPCGTVACVAGWAVLLSRFNGKPEEYAAFMRERNTLFPDSLTSSIGQEELGLSPSQMETLFYVGRWPERFRVAHGQAEENGDYQAMAQITADRIDYMIAEPDAPDNNHYWVQEEDDSEDDSDDDSGSIDLDDYGDEDGFELEDEDEE